MLPSTAPARTCTAQCTSVASATAPPALPELRPATTPFGGVRPTPAATRTGDGTATPVSWSRYVLGRMRCWRWEVGRGGGGDRRRKEDVRGSWGEGWFRWFRWCNVSAARGRWSNAEPSRVCHLVVSCTFRAGMGPVNVWGAFGVLGNILRRLEAPVSPETPPTCQELARSRCLLHPRASGLLYI